MSDAGLPRTTRTRASALVVHEGNLLLVRLRDPVSNVEALYPPGGAIEVGETPAEAAGRETLEETGLRVVVDASSELVDVYPFVWAGTHVAVTTHYFAARLAAGERSALRPVEDAAYNLGASWVPLAEAAAALAVHPVIAAACSRVLDAARPESPRRPSR
ncbi:MAG: cytosine deaminase [Labilithrix sp.]|nr:cytosine deaminase [Labilithrix sp.]